MADGPLAAITYYKLDSSTTFGTQYYWNIKSGGFFYGSGSSSGSFSAVIDSGTTLIYIPTAAAKKFYAKVKRLPNFMPLPCC